MSPHYHPEAPLLLDYAAGSLGAGPRLVIAAHLGACRACAAAVASAEAVGGALLAAMPPVALRPDALALALARIERPDPPSPRPPASPPGWIEIPPDVVRAYTQRRRWAAPGVWVAPVSRGAGGKRCYLLGVAAGMSVPRHTHRGEEMVCVLKGAYADGDSRHGLGDFAVNDESVDHRPTVTADGECVCLVSADNALVARDWVGRLFQPFVGI
jgi:putative transcriptional regulator